MHQPHEPSELERQVRKLRLEVRKLRYAVIACAIGICLTIAAGPGAFVVIAGVAGVVVALMCIAGVARLLADGWDSVSMRWQRARWQAERNKPDEPRSGR